MCKSINLPKGTYKLECWGAQGGSSSYHNTTGGKGGYSTGVYTITNNTTLYLYTGGMGNTGSVSVYGGYNGGGGVTSDYDYGGTDNHLGTGGGASDISLVGGECSLDSYYRYVRTTDSYNNRIIVAGGGGGSEGVGGTAGGGTSGVGAYAGTSSSAGSATIGNASSWVTLYAGGFGYGASTTGGHTNHAMGCCGGGGWYGGGTYADNGNAAYGCGGSGYVNTSKLTSASTTAGNSSFTSPTGSTEIGHSGNGYVRITVIEAKNNLSIYIKNNTWKENSKILFKKTNWINHKNIYIKYNPQSLPTGYTALEYIQSSGTQYINTGVVPSENTKMQIKFSTSTSKGVIAGSDKGYKVSSFMLAVTIATFNTGSLAVSLADGSKHSVKLYSNNVIIDNSNKGSGGSGFFTTTYPIYLFGNNRSGSSSELISGKIYSCSLYNSTTKIRNFIPAKNSSNILGLYDTINKKFYTNAGTGAFTAGPIATASWIKIENL